MAVGCQGNNTDEAESESSGFSSTSSSTELGASVTSLSSTSGVVPSTTGGSGGVPSSTATGSATTLKYSLGKTLIFVGVGWIVLLC